MSQTDHTPQQPNRSKQKTIRISILFLITIIFGSFLWFIAWPALTGSTNSLVNTYSTESRIPKGHNSLFDIFIDGTPRVTISNMRIQVFDELSEGVCYDIIMLHERLQNSSSKPSSYAGEWVSGTLSPGWESSLSRQFEMSKLCEREDTKFNRLNPESTDLPESDLLTSVPQISPYYFPFDRHKIIASVAVGTTPDDGSDEPKFIFTTPHASINAKDWDVEYKLIPFEDFQNASLMIDLKRPLPMRVLFVVIIGTILIASLLLIIVDSTSGVLEVAVGILFSIWSVQEIIKPDYVTWTTLIDSILLMLYLILAIALFIRFVLKPLWFRYDPPLPDETPHPLPPTSKGPQPVVIQNALPPNPTHLRYQFWSLVIGAVTAVLTFLHLINRNKKD